MRTRDVALVTLLRMQGHRWTHLTVIAPGRVEFLFPDLPGVFAVQRDYLAHAASVDARTFMHQYKDVMSEVRAAKGSRPTSPDAEGGPTDAMVRRS